MAIEKVPFRKYSTEESRKDTIRVRVNKEERAMIEKAQRILRQPKDSTALKQLAKVGYIVLHDQKIGDILGLIIDNSRKNKRTGIADYE